MRIMVELKWYITKGKMQQKRALAVHPTRRYLSQ